MITVCVFKKISLLRRKIFAFVTFQHGNGKYSYVRFNCSKNLNEVTNKSYSKTRSHKIYCNRPNILYKYTEKESIFALNILTQAKYKQLFFYNLNMELL